MAVPLADALLYSAVWVVTAAAATQRARHRFAVWTGATVVSIGLADIKPKPSTTREEAEPEVRHANGRASSGSGVER